MIIFIICFNEEKGSLVVLRNEIYNNYSLAYTSKAEGFASRFVEYMPNYNQNRYYYYYYYYYVAVWNFGMLSTLWVV